MTLPTQKQVKSPYGNSRRSICLLSGATATNGHPAAATTPALAGVPVNQINSQNANAGTDVNAGDADSGLNFTGRASREALIIVQGIGTGTTPAVTLRLWGYSQDLAIWVPVHAGNGTGGLGPLASGNEATKGELNNGASIGVSDTTAGAKNILHAERVQNLGLYDRLYLEVVAIDASTTAVTAMIVTARTVAY